MWTGTCVMFVFTALLEFAFVNYASRRDSRNSKAAKSSHIYFYTGELGNINVLYFIKIIFKKDIPLSFCCLTLPLLIDEDDKKNNQENNDGIYNYEEPTANKPEQENLATIEGYNESPRTRRRRVQNPQHIKLMVFLKFLV